jgi:hypothetical protein
MALGPRIVRLLGRQNAPAHIKLLKEKPRRGVQLLGGFKQEPATYMLLALLVSFDLHEVDPQPGSQLLLGEPAEVPPDCNTFSDLGCQIPVEGGRGRCCVLQLLREKPCVMELRGFQHHVSLRARKLPIRSEYRALIGPIGFLCVASTASCGLSLREANFGGM